MKTLLLGLMLWTLPALHAQLSRPTIYIDANDDFKTYVAAAFTKKKVPADLVLDKEKAQYVLTPSEVAVEKQTTGSKITRCLFLYCAGVEDRAHVSVQLVEVSTSKVAWAYSVNKGRGQKNQQSMAESIAEHLKDDYLNKKK